MESSVGSQVRSFVVANYLFGDDGRMPSDDESLIEGGVIDSTGVLELIEYLEETFGISVAESETVPQNLGSIAGIETYVSHKLGASGLAPSA
jgi:acyl carrier protein